MAILKKANDEFYLQIQKFRILTKDSEFKLSEMNPLDMVQKFMVITNDPYVIWDAFEDNQPGYFSAVLMEKYNIGQNFQ